jgi:S-DNA-T family DNA segregation ATPase FtsK/SpoIIIE
MIKKATKDTSAKAPKTPIFAFLKTRQSQTIIAAFLILFACFLAIAFFSFFFNWQEDQSTLTQLANKKVLSKNLLGKIGANLSHFFIYKGFGIGAFIIAFQVGITGLYLIFQKKIGKIIISWNWALLMMLWISIAFGFMDASSALLSGTIGYEVNDYLQRFLGKTGLAIVLIFFIIILGT